MRENRVVREQNFDGCLWLICVVICVVIVIVFVVLLLLFAASFTNQTEREPSQMPEKR